MDFNKSIFIDNISLLLERKERKISELEDYADVSRGYVSRLAREEKTKPSIEFVVSVANFFHVDITELISCDLNELSPAEEYLINLLIKLIEDTKSSSLEWEAKTTEFIHNFQPDSDDDYTGHIFSNSFGEKSTLASDIYSLRLKNYSSLLVFSVNAHESDEKSTEVWISRLGEPSEFLCSTHQDYSLAAKIINLYSSIVDYLRHPMVSSRYKYILDAFMRNDFSDDEGEMPF